MKDKPDTRGSVKLAVLGATGSVGREVVAQALAIGDAVTVLVREKPRPGEGIARAAKAGSPRPSRSA